MADGKNEVDNRVPEIDVTSVMDCLKYSENLWLATLLYSMHCDDVPVLYKDFLATARYEIITVRGRLVPDLFDEFGHSELYEALNYIIQDLERCGLVVLLVPAEVKTSLVSKNGKHRYLRICLDIPDVLIELLDCRPLSEAT